MPPALIRRLVVLAALACAGAAQAAEGQTYGDPIVPRGRLRLRADPVFASWDSRFGLRTENGTTVEEEEPLGRDLTDPLGTSLFPGIATLEEQIRILGGDPTYTANAGSFEGLVGHQITRVDFGFDLGVTDWLTLGFTVPWLRTETTVETAYRPDAAAVDLGVSPALANGETLVFFLQEVQDAATAARLDADQRCASSPASPGCINARNLSNRASAMHRGLETAYFASPFFPLPGTAGAAALSASLQALSSDLSAAGLPGIASTMLFAGSPFTEADFAMYPTEPTMGVNGAPLAHLRSLWDYGDLEATAHARILGSAPALEGASPPAWRYGLTGGVLLRMGTGKHEDPDVFLDLGWGDQQFDIEGRMHALLSHRERFGLLANARYGVQTATNVFKRVAPHELVLPSLDTKRIVEWTPGSYLGIDVAPRVGLTRTLSLTAEYRYFGKAADRFRIPEGQPGATLDAAVLERETEITLHHGAFGLTYSTVRAFREGRASAPMEFDLRVVHAIAGGGGRAPAWTRFEMGIHVFRRIWG